MKTYWIFIFALLVSCGEEVDESSSENLPEFDTSEYGDHLLFWNFEDSFESKEESKLKEWVTTVVDATTATIGYYPFDIHFYFKRSTRGNQAVSFGHTIRGPEQSVRFYVNPEFPLEDFVSDWVAPHEISHLSQPFVGRRNKWFSEGYATYMSRQIMIEMGYYTEEEFDSLYSTKIGNTLDSYGSTTRTHIEVSDSLMENYNYGDMYWGSASFFFTADKTLKEKQNIRFRDVVRDYQSGYRLNDKSLLSIIQSYDEISNDSIFTELMIKYRNDPSIEVMKDF